MFTEHVPCTAKCCAELRADIRALQPYDGCTVITPLLQMKEIASSPAILKEWESEPGKQLVQGHRANKRAAAPNSFSRRLSLPPSLPGAQRGASFSCAPSDHFCPLPEFSASSPQAPNSEVFPDSSPHVLHPWAPRVKVDPHQLCFSRHPVRRPLVFQPCREGQTGALSWPLNTQQSRRGGQASPQ